MVSATSTAARASREPSLLAMDSSRRSTRASTFRSPTGQPFARLSASAASSALSFSAASRLRTRMRAAPRLDTSSIFSTVYTLPAASRISCTWSVVRASKPQPKLFSWIRSRSSRWVATLAAAYRRVWYIHWSTTRMGRSSVPRCAMLSSVSTARPKLVSSSGMAWFISGSMW